MLQLAPRLPDVSRIAVLRANAIGDFLYTLPALEAVRAAYPRAKITLLGRPWHTAFLSDRPSPIDRVIAIPPCRGVGEPEEFVNNDRVLEQFFQEMADQRFDLALQLHGGGRYSNPFVRRLGARMTVGLKAPDAEPLDRWMPYIFYQKEIVRFLETVALIGAPPVTLEPQIAVTDADLSEARAVVDMDARPLVVLHPGASDPRRRWPPEKFAAVGDTLAGSGACIAVIGSGAEEQSLAEAVVGSMRAEALDLAGRFSLGGLAGLLAQSRVVVANDSGPLHLAAAVGTATVGIYWATNLITAGEHTRTRHRPLLAWRLDCPECGANCIMESCGHQASLVTDVPVDDVVVQARDLLTA